MTFTLFDGGTGGSQVGQPLTNSAVGVTNGMFNLLLDFGANFPGADRWLEMGVRTNGADSFTTVSPRQQITPVPYAITASNLSGTLPVGQLTGTLSSGQLGGNFAFHSITNNEFAIRATDGARIVTAIDGSGNITAGVNLNPGDTSWSTISDRNAKKDFTPIDGEDVLDKLSQVPVEQWHYKWESDDSTPHIGPMAQDFKHAFYPGRDDKSISTLEFDGVELAAIEGLNQKLKDQAATIQSKDARINDLEQRLERLEKIISTGEK